MSSSPVTGPSAELIRYAHGSNRIARTCRPCVTAVLPMTRGSAHRPRSARIGCSDVHEWQPQQLAEKDERDGTPG